MIKKITGVYEKINKDLKDKLSKYVGEEVNEHILKKIKSEGIAHISITKKLK
jgi:hypothetical protein